MAELDDKLLKTLDDRLKNMLTTMTSLDSVIQTVVTNSKSSLTDLISLFQASGASLTDMLQAFKGNRLADLLGIKDAAGQVKQLNEQIETLNRNTKMGGKASWVEDEDTGRGSWKVLKGDEFKNEKEERDAINTLAEARQKLRDLTLSDAQLWEKIVALINKAAVETQKESAARESALQKEYKQQEEERKRLAKVQQEDAAWHEKQRANQAAVFAENGKAIEQQRQLADQIDILTRKKKELVKSESGQSVTYDSRNYTLVLEYEKKIQELRELQSQIERQFQGSMKAGESAFASTKIERDNAEVRKKIAQEEINAAKQKAQQAKEAAAIQKKADAESMANQRRQIQIKSQLSSIDKNRITITKQSSDREKALAEQQQADYRSLQSELSKLIARQKELNAVSQGSGRRAKDRLSTYTISESEKAMRRYADAVRNAHREQKKLGDETNKMLPTIQRLASAFGVAFSVRGLAQFGKKLIETRGEFERQQVALRSILQNKQLADEIWDKTMRAALQSPFTAMQLTTYTKQLAAYRIETDKLFETTKRLADVSAGLGVDMNRLILAYGQVKAANYLRASEIRQFTEAGVNILGELSRYFSDTRNQMYSTAQVMEMVTKRMVKFEDVEAIFKRMTDQGGIFYDMQYVQSQTVRGQIMKLHDAYDQMLNSIGKANQGTLRTFVGLLNNIVKNWREWKTVLDSIAFPLLIASVYKFARGLFYANAGAIAMNKNVNSLTRAGARLNLTFKKLNATLAANPWMLLVEVLTIAGTAIWNHAKAVREVNKEYDEMNGRLLETQYRMTSYEDKINKNNAILKDSSKSTKEHNKAQEENKKILSELQRDYPDVASSMTIANNGIITMTNSMKEYNAQLRLQILLNERAKAGFFNQSLKKDASQFDEAIKKQQIELAQYTNQAQRVASVIQNGIETNKIKVEEFGEVLAAVLQMASALSVEEYDEALKNFQNIRVKGDFASSALERELTTLGIGGSKFYFKSIAESHRLKSTRAEVMDEIKDDYKLFGDYLTTMTKLSDNFTGEMALTSEEFIKKNADVIQSMLYTIKDDGTVVMGELGYALSQAFADAASVAQTEQGAQEIVDEYIRQFKEKYGLDVKFGLKKKKEGPNYDPAAEEAILSAWRKRIRLIEDMNKKYNELSKSVYGYAKSEQKVRDAFQDAWKAAGMPFDMSSIDFTSDQAVAEALKMFRGRIPSKILDELEKTISERESTVELNLSVRIREDFARQMEEAFGNYELTIELDKLNLPSDVLSDMFDIESVNLSDLRNKVVQYYEEQVAKEADPTELVKQVEGYYKKIDEMERKQQRERLKDYAKYLEYELSERAKIEMEYVRKSAEVATTRGLTNEQKQAIDRRLKKERDEKLAKQEWEDFKSSETYIQMMEDLEHQGVGALEVMRQELERIRANAENLSPRALKEVVNALEKIDEIAIKRGMPIGNILRASGSIKDAKAAAVEAGLEADQVKSRKAARETLEGIKKTILEREKEYRTLSNQLGVEKELARLEAERAANNARMDAMFGDTFAAESDEQIQQRIKDTVSNIETSRNNIAKYQEEAKEADEETLRTVSTKVAEEEANIECLHSEKELLEKSLELRIAIAKSEANRGELTDDERKQLQERVEQLEEELKKLQGQASAVGNVTKKYGILGDTWNDAFQKFGQWGSQIEQTFESLKEMMKALGTDIDTDTWDTLSTSFSVLSTTVSTAASAAAKFAAEDYIGGSLDIIKGLFDITKSIAELYDKKIDRSIEKSKEKVEDLQKAYDRLEKSIEKTFDTVSYMRTYNEEVQNLYEQIEKANEQINAAQGYKDADKRKEAIEAAEDAKQEALDALDEIKQKQIEVFGGIGEDNYRSAAEGFVDAWKSAFLETGDGLQGLQDHFDEFLNDWFVKQATMRVTAKMLEPLFNQIDQAVDQYSGGGANVLMSELQSVREKFGVIAPQLSEALEDLAHMWGLEGEGSLSGLAAGIQGMTEEQANILEAYWNSVRGYTASIDMNVARIVDLMTAEGSRGVDTNPQIKNLEAIAYRTERIDNILHDVWKSGHPEGSGGGFKVFVN